MAELNKIMKELEELTDEQLKSVIYAVECQQVHRRHTNEKRFSELLQPVKDAIKNLIFEFPRAHCYIDGGCIYPEDLILNDAVWELKD